MDCLDERNRESGQQAEVSEDLSWASGSTVSIATVHECKTPENRVVVFASSASSIEPVAAVLLSLRVISISGS